MEAAAAAPPPSPFRRLGPVTPASPVVVSVPHAGREYPAAMLPLLSVPVARLAMLEDRFVDAVAQGAVRHETMLVATRARAWIDLNRSPTRDRDPQVDAGAPAGTAVARSDKVRSGIGLIPRRAGGADNMWRRKLTDAEVTTRIEQDHAPYHEAVEAALRAARARFGVAVLLDLHSMPPLGDLSPARIVLGDRFGRSCAGGLSEAAAGAVHAHGVALAMNHPYAGGHILAAHASPRAGIHAIQIEIDRRLYLDDALDRPGAGLPDTVRLVRAVIDALDDAALATGQRLAAE